mmetsp:Transcript_5896/g.9564  ORF Transcript_5896/g.9564 Transcript_5896/m.9564 type:complete len:119 (-) Transcript_5896:193-549(-)|eukprot:CAMPEP_0170481456 /NCGR_PEP_ID=MMETSP0208-20121228/1894_1 /TAXON_ID=197538 /ORGANISM="Strombidium inclinatum, Strain S3" /LENGTH=118 /DNA_ID=CAMNT_0010754165 /DNA_START=26 /DNA_END=382 /DNA_ORIENTATION=-
MASVEASKLSAAEHDELCCSYAALMLHEEGLEITGEKLLKVIKASGNSVEPYWPSLFAKALKGADVNDMLTNVASAAPVAGGAVAAGGAAEVVEEKEEKKEEEEDVDMGGLFGDEEDY